MKTTIGGDRLGSGSKQEVSMRNYERSTHDLSYLWRSSMAAGTLVPFMSELALPGDSWDIDLNCEVMTLPTVGPLFGSFKVQLDVFEVPIRLYNGKLHMNMLNIGMDMSSIYLPEVRIDAKRTTTYTAESQVNPSSLASYLGIKGVGRFVGTGDYRGRWFNAVPLLSYWDIYKQYYANKQEEIGYVIHNPMNSPDQGSVEEALVRIDGEVTGTDMRVVGGDTIDFNNTIVVELYVELPTELRGQQPAYDPSEYITSVSGVPYPLTTLFTTFAYRYTDVGCFITCSNQLISGVSLDFDQWPEGMPYLDKNIVLNAVPQLISFALTNIDDMRMDILSDVKSTTAYQIKGSGSGTLAPAPYNYCSNIYNSITDKYSILSTQQGLGIKTYQSDLFNNWISTEWIDGTNGINEVTAVDTTGDTFTIDALNLANKVYNMLNRIALSGGSYDDWLDAVYMQDRAKGQENPIYHGSLIKELAFEEVISTSDTSINGNEQPLGTLAGRGRLTSKNKGGKMKIKVNEPSYIIGIVSLTPRVDYSQGNKWDLNLKTMNDLHKPALDEIGFQDLITDQMAYFDTDISDDGTITYRSAGKQPAWINYMTNYNKTFGNYAIENKEMFMTLNRRYESNVGGTIKDVTTYIDPSKYNNIFAQTSLDAQNFWVQISNNITARRKMSAKVIPNL